MDKRAALCGDLHALLLLDMALTYGPHLGSCFLAHEVDFVVKALNH